MDGVRRKEDDRKGRKKRISKFIIYDKSSSITGLKLPSIKMMW